MLRLLSLLLPCLLLCLLPSLLLVPVWLRLRHLPIVCVPLTVPVRLSSRFVAVCSFAAAAAECAAVGGP